MDYCHYLLLCISVIGLQFKHGQSGRVLITHSQLKSHQLEGILVGKGLVDLGHEVYTVAAKPFHLEEFAIKNGLQVLYYKTPNGTVLLDSKEMNQWISKLLFSKTSDMERENSIRDKFMESCYPMMEDSDFLEKVKTMNFDIAVYDGFPFAPCMITLPYHLKIPYVYEFSIAPVSMPATKLTPAFIPSVMSGYTDKMTIWEKLKNLLWTYLEINSAVSQDIDLLRKYGHGATSWQEVISKSLLFIISRDHILEFPRPCLPNVIHTPGLTIQTANPLPQSFEKLMVGSNRDVVLVSFGTLTDLDFFPKDIINKFFRAFEHLQKFLFICKFTVDIRNDISQELDIPENVELFNWLPQNDILGHPKTKVFITHGGNNGRYEATYHGVPVVCFPFFGDQPANCRQMVSRKLGITLDIFTFSVNDLVAAIQTVTNINSDYIYNSKKLSSMMKSLPEKPRDTMAFWVDHVMNFGGQHLYSPAQDMTMSELMMWDIIFVGHILILLFVLSFILMCRFCKASRVKAKQS